MSDAAPPLQPAVPSGDAAPAGPLTPDAIDRVLADFRAWLADLAALPPAPTDAPAIDLHVLVAQFTALRHEVNLQTRAARSALEQNAETVEQLSQAFDALDQRSAEDESETLRPILKTAVDVYDNLALALRQVTKQREAIDQPLAEVADGATIPEPPLLPEAGAGFWSRLWGRRPDADFAVAIGRQAMSDWRASVLKEVEARRQRVADAANLVRSSLDGLIAGYRMSLNRVGRVLAQYEMEPIVVEGEQFDPELMEAVEVAGDTGRPAGEVVEEVRRGYRWRGVVFRFAQVKVAR
jgi:molecular chaperone GrpE